MALDKILQSMEEQAEQAQKQILAEAQAEADRIIAEGKRRAGEIYAAESEQILSPLRAERTRIVNEARLELQHGLQSEKEALWNLALAKARSEISEVRTGADYERVFSALYAEAVNGMEQELIVEVAPNDRAVAEKIVAQEQGRQVKVEVTGDSLGGLTAFSPSTQVRAINTLDSRLERVTSNQISDLAAKLFAPSGEKAEG